MVGEVAVGGLPAMLCSSACVKRKKCDEFASLDNFLSIHFFPGGEVEPASKKKMAKWEHWFWVTIFLLFESRKYSTLF